MISAAIARRFSLGSGKQRIGGLVSALAVVGLALGTGLLITVVSIMNGFDRELRERILAFVPHVRVYTGAPLQDWQADRQVLMAHDQVLLVSPFLEAQALAQARGRTLPIQLLGVDIAHELDQGMLPGLLNSEDFLSLEARSDALLLGEQLAIKLGVSAGDQLLLIGSGSGEMSRGVSARRIEVVGVFRTGTDVDHSVAIGSISTVAAVAQQPDAPQALSVHLRDPFDSYLVAHDLLRQLSHHYRAQTWTASHGNLYQAIEMSRTMVGLIVLLILGIAAFNVLSSLMIAGAEKQTSIAVLKTLGATRGILLRAFTLQGLLIGVVGAGVGVLLGVLMCLSLGPVLSLYAKVAGHALLQSNIYPLDYLPIEFIPLQMLGIALAAVVLSTLGAVYPAFRMLSVRPADTLRHE